MTSVSATVVGAILGAVRATSFIGAETCLGFIRACTPVDRFPWHVASSILGTVLAVVAARLFASATVRGWTPSATRTGSPSPPPVSGSHVRGASASSEIRRSVSLGRGTIKLEADDDLHAGYEIELLRAGE